MCGFQSFLTGEICRVGVLLLNYPLHFCYLVKWSVITVISGLFMVDCCLKFVMDSVVLLGTISSATGILTIVSYSVKRYIFVPLIRIYCSS